MAAKRTKLQEAVVADLQRLAPERFVSDRILEPVPHLFKNDAVAYKEWRHELAARLKVDPKALALVGSAAVGLSLSPAKNLAPFPGLSSMTCAGAPRGTCSSKASRRK